MTALLASALAIYDAHPLLVLAVLGVVLSVTARATRTRSPALSAALYRVAAVLPVDITRMVAGIGAPSRDAIERALIEAASAELRADAPDAPVAPPPEKVAPAVPPSPGGTS